MVFQLLNQQKRMCCEHPGQTGRWILLSILAIVSPATQAFPATGALQAPAGWTISRRGDLTVLVPPENDSRIVVLQVPASAMTSGEQAVAELWRQLGEVPPPPLGDAPLPAELGWKERRAVTYSSGSRSVVLIRQHSNTHWGLVLQDLSAANAERRAAAVQMVVDSVQAPAYTRESFAGRRAQPLTASHQNTLRAFVEKARKELKVPGVALAIMQKGRVVMAEGFGEQRLGSGQRVDGDTLFMVGSTTKPLTSLLAARLVDEGRLDWNAAIGPLLPELQLEDPAAAGRLQVRHLFCACSGVPRRDIPWALNRDVQTPEGVLRSMARLQPNSPPDAVFQYSNQMAAAAGYLAARVVYPDLELGAAYNRAMAELVIRPLGMASTTLDFDQALSSTNLAEPHGFNITGDVVAIDPDSNRSLLGIRPAGAAWSSANDMLRYVALELRGGKLPDGRRLLSEEALRARWRPQVEIGRDSAYGLLLVRDESLGTPMLWHNGSTSGYKSLIWWLPEHDLGAVVLTNCDQGDTLVDVVRRRLLELTFAGDRIAEGELAQMAAANQATRADLVKGLALPADPWLVAQLAPQYLNPDLGPLSVRRQGDQILFDLGGVVSLVGSKIDNAGRGTFVTIGPAIQIQGLEFMLNGPDGQTLELRDKHQIYRYEATQEQRR